MMQFSPIHSSVPTPQTGIIFVLQMPSTFSTTHNKFEQDRLLLFFD